MGYFLSVDLVDVVGLSGKAGSGKDFLAKEALVPEGFVPLALANQFKVDAVVKRGVNFGEVFGPMRKSPQTRDLLQKMGTEWGREKHGKDVWCKACELHMLFFLEHGIDKFCITDVRFQNEVEWIQDKLGGLVYRITGRGGAESEETRQHISETELDGFNNFDVVIDNSPERGAEAITDLRESVKKEFSL
jgi:hypothetical protein